MPAAGKKPKFAAKEYPKTPDGRYFVVRGRLWRLTNPHLSEDARMRLTQRLMKARRNLRDAKGADRAALRTRIDRAKRGLGERGPAWWSDGAPDFNRRLVKNTPYIAWYAKLKKREC